MRWEAFLQAVLLMCSMFLQSACLSSAGAPESPEAAVQFDRTSAGLAATMAELVGFEEIADGIRIRVITTGCTRADDFELVVDRVDDDRVQLTVLRSRPDDCRRMPAAKTVEFSRESMGLEDEAIILMNPLVALPGRG